MSAVARLADARTNTYSDDTGPRIRAYVDSVQLLGGCAMADDTMARFLHGAILLERMACSAIGEGRPAIRLTADECADVLDFMAWVEPKNGARWHREPTDRPSHIVGLMIVLHTLADSLRAADILQ